MRLPAPRTAVPIALAAGVLVVVPPMAAALLGHHDGSTPAAGPMPADSGPPGAATPGIPSAATPGKSASAASRADSVPIAQLPDRAWVTRTAQAAGIPSRALAAYAGAALAEAQRRPGCHLGWNTLAGIGAVESAHGTMGSASLAADGTVTPPIVGLALDGRGVRGVPDTDHGRLDGDSTWDHAVGPMQFIPSTWASYARDGNGDGVRDIDNIDDAALAAADYLCDGGRDLGEASDWIAAVAAYNPDVGYNNRVVAAADAYAARAATVAEGGNASGR